MYTMGSAEQMQQMLDLLQQQVTTMNAIQQENARLRVAVATGAPTDGVDNGIAERSRYKSKRPDRPLINASIDDREWALFNDEWTRYKKMCNIAATDEDSIRLELRASCSSEVNKLLFEYIGASVLDASSETELLGHIKTVAVKTIHKEVHRLAFHAMSQDQGESVTQFVARLKAKAFLCSFEVPCTCCTPTEKISYAEEEVAQRLVAGLRNQEHQRKVLSEAATLTTLEQKIGRLQILESTEESVSTLHKPSPTPPSQATPARSQYRQTKSQTIASGGSEGTTAPKCKWCGRTSHPNGKPLDQPNCPAKEKECYKCKRKGHLRQVCETFSETPAAAATSGNATTETLEPLTSGASVSFSFSAQQEQQDFRETRKPTAKP